MSNEQVGSATVTTGSLWHPPRDFTDADRIYEASYVNALITCHRVQKDTDEFVEPVPINDVIEWLEIVLDYDGMCLDDYSPVKLHERVRKGLFRLVKEGTIIKTADRRYCLPAEEVLADGYVSQDEKFRLPFRSNTN